MQFCDLNVWNKTKLWWLLIVYTCTPVNQSKGYLIFFKFLIPLFKFWVLAKYVHKNKDNWNFLWFCKFVHHFQILIFMTYLAAKWTYIFLQEEKLNHNVDISIETNHNTHFASLKHSISKTSPR